MMPLRICMRTLLLCALPALLHATPPEPLPEPLSLEYALSLASEGHPDVLDTRAAQAMAQSEWEAADARDALSASVEGRLRWVRPPSFDDENIADDHKLSLFIRKPLYDFGRTASELDAAGFALKGSDLHHQFLLEQHRLRIMEAFFNVILADMAYDRDMEGLAMAFIRLDRLRNRQELGQASDIEILELEREFEQARHELALSSGEQRATRARLASILNRPGMLPSTLSRPVLAYRQRTLPDFNKLYEEAVQNNPAILALEAEVAAAQQRVTAAQAEARPRLDGELEASHYTREQGSSDRLRAGIYLTVPLYTGGRVDAAVGAQRAKLYQAQAGLERGRYQLRQQLLDNWLELQALELKYQQAVKEQEYRDLYLDRSRANYEMEVRSDLGDAMVRLSEAQLGTAQADYRLALAWEQLDMLLGKSRHSVNE